MLTHDFKTADGVQVFFHIDDEGIVVRVKLNEDEFNGVCNLCLISPTGEVRPWEGCPLLHVLALAEIYSHAANLWKRTS